MILEPCLAEATTDREGTALTAWKALGCWRPGSEKKGKKKKKNTAIFCTHLTEAARILQRNGCQHETVVAIKGRSLGKER